MGKYNWLLIGFLLLWAQLPGQNVATDFGKNRIQYHDDFDLWDMYETENFVTYWYGKGREIAHTVVQMAELDNPAIQKVLEHKMNDKIELILYVDLTDMKQSNLGIEDQFTGKGGITKVIENKVFLYFNGDHNELRKQLREGIAAVYINSMLHGNSLQEIVQNAVLLNLPDWFQEGLIAYIGQDWSPEIDSRLRDYFTNPKKKKKDFANLTKADPRLAGHSMWYYLARTYGKASISNILYLTRINRSLENGLLYVLGIDSKELARQWQDYFQKRFSDVAEQESELRQDLSLLPHKKRQVPFGRMRLSPDGTKLAYTLVDNSRNRLYLYDMQSGEKEVLFRYGIRNLEQEADFNYPVLAWGPDGKELTIIYEKRDVVFLKKFDFEEDTEFTDKLSPEYHRVYDLDYWSADTLVMAATTDGFSDLYLYMPVTRQSIRMTEDFWDDLDASVIHLDNERYVLFSSNRENEVLKKMGLDSLLPIGPFDLYLLDYSPIESSLRQLTFTGDISERKARMSGVNDLVCLADISGRWQRIRVSQLNEEPPLAEIHTRYDRDIKMHETVPGGNHLIIDWLQKWNMSYVQTSLVDSTSVSQHTSVTPQGLISQSNDTIPQDSLQDDEKVDPQYLFQTPYAKPTPKITVQEKETPQKPAITVTPSDQSLVITSRAAKRSYDPDNLVPFVRPRIIASRLKFKLDYFNATLNNDILFGGLDSYAGTKREFEPSPLGLLIKGSVKDLLEDYIITGGARYPTTFNGSEYFLVFDNRKRRIDKQFAVYRKSLTESDPNELNSERRNQYVTVLGLARYSFPFDVYNSLRATLTLRNDRTIILATDVITLANKTDDAQRIGLKMEWVYDNTRETDINSRTGSRAKFWGEVVERFDLNLFEHGPKLQFDEGFMTVLGFDARHYAPLDTRTIFAARMTAATTFGSERILYYLGGVENWLFSSYDNSVGIPPNVNFAYNTLAANMRGFKYNARNGSSVALVNLELRSPIFQYLSRQKLQSSFLRNIQVVGFLDAGTAWHGKDPFDPQNPLNTVVVVNPPTVTAVVNYYRNPLIVGYGFGVRSLIFGYLLKLDYGWNWESNASGRPLVHFSMGADF